MTPQLLSYCLIALLGTSAYSQAQQPIPRGQSGETESVQPYTEQIIVTPLGTPGENAPGMETGPLDTGTGRLGIAPANQDEGQIVPLPDMDETLDRIRNRLEGGRVPETGTASGTQAPGANPSDSQTDQTEAGQSETAAIPAAPQPSQDTTSTTILPQPIPIVPTQLQAGVTLRELDKMTGRHRTIDVPVGRTVDIDRLRVTVDACRAPEDNSIHGTKAFLRIWDKRKTSPYPDFSGWMFAESPSLSALDHPRYDLWVINCITRAGT